MNVRLSAKIAVLVLSALAFPSSNLNAHNLPNLKRVFLYVGKERIRVTIQMLLNDADYAYNLRERFDRNCDRLISATEREAMIEYLLARSKDVPIKLNGQKLSFVFDQMSASGFDHPLPSAYPLTLQLKGWAMLQPSQKAELCFGGSETSFTPTVELHIELEKGLKLSEVEPSQFRRDDRHISAIMNELTRWLRVSYIQASSGDERN